MPLPSNVKPVYSSSVSKGTDTSPTIDRRKSRGGGKIGDKNKMCRARKRRMATVMPSTNSSSPRKTMPTAIFSLASTLRYRPPLLPTFTYDGAGVHAEGITTARSGFSVEDDSIRNKNIHPACRSYCLFSLPDHILHLLYVSPLLVLSPEHIYHENAIGVYKPILIIYRMMNRSFF